MKSVIVETGSSLIGKTVEEAEHFHMLEIKQLENFSDRIIPFSFEKLPKNTIIKEGDCITVSGEKIRVREFCQTASLN